MRVRMDGDKFVSLDTSIVRYHNSDDPAYKDVTVDLIGAVHIGENGLRS